MQKLWSSLQSIEHHFGHFRPCHLMQRWYDLDLSQDLTLSLTLKEDMIKPNYKMISPWSRRTLPWPWIWDEQTMTSKRRMISYLDLDRTLWDKLTMTWMKSNGINLTWLFIWDEHAMTWKKNMTSYLNLDLLEEDNDLVPSPRPLGWPWPWPRRTGWPYLDLGLWDELIMN